jgi:hypothetical protein
MLEIIFIAILCTKLGATLRQRGYPKPVWFQVGLVVLWFGTQFTGAFFFALIREMLGYQRPTGMDFFAYLAGLSSAAIAMVTVFILARSLPLRLDPPALPRQPLPRPTGPRPPMPQGRRPGQPAPEPPGAE